MFFVLRVLCELLNKVYLCVARVQFPLTIWGSLIDKQSELLLKIVSMRDYLHLIIIAHKHYLVCFEFFYHLIYFRFRSDHMLDNVTPSLHLFENVLAVIKNAFLILFLFRGGGEIT